MSTKLKVTTVTVTTAGTQVQATSTNTYVEAVYFEAVSGNTGYIYIGDENVSNAFYAARLPAAEGFSIGIDKGKADNRINLANIWIDSSVNGEKVQMTYLEGYDAT